MSFYSAHLAAHHDPADMVGHGLSHLAGQAGGWRRGGAGMPSAKVLLSIFVGIGILTLLLIWRLPSSAPPPSVPPPLSLAPLPLPIVPLPPGNDAASMTLRQSIHNGERIYQRLCYHCHGHQGKGDRNDYMESIGHKPADHTDLKAMQRLSDAEFFRILHDGVTDQRGWLTMPPWSSVLTDAEMWDVIRYVRRLPLPPETLP